MLLDDREWLVEQYETKSLLSIGTELGVSPATVRRAFIRHGIQRHSRGELASRRFTHPLLADRNWLVERYARSTQVDIAAECDVNVVTVHRALKTHLIAIRPTGVGPRHNRPAELDDPDWLETTYQTARSIRTIAHELGVNEQMVGAALRRHNIKVRSDMGRHLDSLADTTRLGQMVDQQGTKQTAESLGVSQPGVQRSLAAAQRPSPHRHESARLTPPSPDALQQLWGEEETIKGVARRCGVSVNTAAIWLAQIQIFVSPTPSISRTDLLRAIEANDTIDTIRRRHKTAARTVVVELHRHDLFHTHRRRHLHHPNSKTGPSHSP